MADKTTNFDRRTFMRRGAMGAGALWTVSLTELMHRQVSAQEPVFDLYGPIAPTVDQNTGLPLIRLPAGFKYWSLHGWQGDRMSDGIRTPALHDGMAVTGFYNNNPDWLVLVRNHESGAGAAFGGKPSIVYDPNAAGGTTSLVFDAKRQRFIKSWSSLSGTIRNCAGGVTPWGTWLTCEETTDAGHGWTFDVPPLAGDPTPIIAMGRFSHEAMMVDPLTGFVYETEDQGTTSGFYKFVPNVYGQLKQGGELFMLKVKGQNQFNFAPNFGAGTTWDVEWVKIDDPTAATQSCFSQGFTGKNAARFRRLEGCWWGTDTGYFLTTEGAGSTQGQVFEYDPVGETVKLIYESPNATALDNPDNMCVTPRGSLLLCEDAATGPDINGERMVGLTLDGKRFVFAQNNVNLTGIVYNDRIAPQSYITQEWAGACFSPDGRWLFANIQTPGITFAITGPWEAGPL